MENFSLQLLFQIIGVGAASGLVYKENSLVLISDDSGFLYEYTIDSNTLERYPILENPAENMLKKDKPDFESITYFEDIFYVLGSGSTEKRTKMIQFDAKNKQVIKTTNLSDLYIKMQSFGKIKPEDFNIEGAIYNGENWLLFNRGNGRNTKNIIFSIQGKSLIDKEFDLISNSFNLPKIKGVTSSFTDAILVEDKIYFLAAAENTTSTYEDGEVLGSIIGSIDIETMKIDFTKIITNTQKFEGLTLYKKTATHIELLLCEDNDTNELVSTIYKLKVEL